MTIELHHDADATSPGKVDDPRLHRPMDHEPDAGEYGPAPASPVRLGRMAGLLYLAVAIFGGFAMIVRVKVYAPGDATATAANLVANATLVRLSFVADLVQALAWLVLAVTLYRLLAHAGRSIARAMVVFVAVSAAITSLNMVHQLGALMVATNHSYTAALGVDGSNALALLLMDLQHNGYLIAQLGWLWLFAVGLLGLRSGLFPKWLSFLLMLATVCYVADALTRFLAPSFADTSAAIFVVPEIVCEVSLLAYLLIRGVRTPHPTAPRFASA
ncbi:MAG: DUF4386 domain-containing protein [Lapillicoccus sp.]